VARSVQIDAPAEAVFEKVNSLKAAQDWSPWLGRDPEMTVEYAGPEAGVGAEMTWASDDPQVGQGHQKIVVSEANRRVETELDFGDMGMAKAAFILETDAAGTAVTWTLLADMGAGPVGRWMGLMMDGWVGPDYEAGLANLKALVEG
ncbi:MAG: SRPBCC family protein, partial [Pseudomonadota bacterium]